MESFDGGYCLLQSKVKAVAANTCLLAAQPVLICADCAAATALVLRKLFIFSACSFTAEKPSTS